jgi:hypothetical protein
LTFGHRLRLPTIVGYQLAESCSSSFSQTPFLIKFD